MSSILKALKKIEGGKAETRLPSWPYRTNNRESMGANVFRAWRRQRILGFLILICAVALAVKLFYGIRVVSHDTVPEARLAENAPSPPVPVEESKSAGPSLEKSPAPSPSSPAVLPEPSPRTVAGPAAAAPDPNIVDIPVETPVQDADLTLQALVWSEQPEERFVIINEKIVREGGGVNGSVVSRIGPDYVLIRSGGTVWRLKYGQGS